MKHLTLFFIFFIVSCGSPYPQEIHVKDDYCLTEYRPFYHANHDALLLEVECACQDSMVDLGTKLSPYTALKILYFHCDEHHFNLIPEMVNVELLETSVVTPNITNAFPNLDRLRLKNATDFYQGLKNLAINNFDLDYKYVSEIPPSISQLTNTTSLEVFGNVTSELALPNDIGNMINLDKLRLSNVQDLPNSMAQLTNLTELYIKGNSGLEPKLPTNIGNLTNLKRLELNSVDNLPISLSQLTNLEYINMTIYNTELSFPPIFDNMNNLEELYLFGTLQSATQTSIYNAQNLKILEIEDPSLTSLEPEIGQLTNLEALNITGSAVSTFPTTIGNLTNLKSLKCRGLPITNFPMEIVNLNELEYLDFKGCQMTSVPSEIGNFTNLETLSFTQNSLTSLPPEIENLKDNLKTLFLSGNNFNQTEKNNIKSWLPNTEIYF